jgi:RNA polymerase sigma factor (sigma-70 family)
LATLAASPTAALPPAAESADFVDFLRRIRAGDEGAASELVRRFEPLIRREVRMRLGDERLRRSFDSIDVSQSVLAYFLARAANGQYELDRPEQLVRLLLTMARNRLISRARSERRQIRNVGRLSTEPGALELVVDARPSSSEILSRKEEVELLKTSLCDEERQVFELRSQGLSWDEVASRLGGTGQSRRMQLSRGLKRLGQRLRPVE